MFDIFSKIRMMFRSKPIRSAAFYSRKRPVNLSQIQEVIQEYCKKSDEFVFSEFEKIYNWWSGSRSRNLNCNNLILAFIREIGKSDTLKAIHFAEQFPPREADARFDQTLAEYYLKNSRPIMALNHVNRTTPSKSTNLLRERIEYSLELDNYSLNEVPPFIKHRKDVKLSNKEYTLYLPSQHLNRENTTDIMKMSGVLTLPKEAPLNSALMTINFYDKKGNKLEFNSNTLLKASNIVGPYQPLNPEEDGTFTAFFKPPEEFNYALINFRNWKNVSGIRLGPVLELTSSIEHNNLDSMIEHFGKICRLYSDTMVFVYGCNHSDPSKSIDRASRIISTFTELKISTINGYHRKDRHSVTEDYLKGNNIHIPLDFANPLLAQLSSRDYGGVKKSLFISKPTPSIIRNVHHFNSDNWVVICDLHSWRMNHDSEFTQGQLHLISNSNLIIVENKSQHDFINDLQIPNLTIIQGSYGWLESTKKKTRQTLGSELIGILQRGDGDLDLASIAAIAQKMPNSHFDILGSNWSSELDQPSNVKTWTIRDSKWVVERMLTWDLALDFPISTNLGLPLGIHELRNNKIPCILPTDGNENKTLPYLIRYNNISQLDSAIQEASIMDRAYTPKSDLKDWGIIGKEIIAMISTITLPQKQVSRFDYLPMVELISLAEKKPPKMDEIKSRVKDAFSSQGITVYRDLIWSLDYLCSNDNLPRHIANNLLIGSIRGIGAVDPYTAIQLAESFEFEDKRYARTMVSYYNKTEQYRKSLDLVKSMKNGKWKGKMTATLQRKLASGIPTKQRTGFFDILPHKDVSPTKRDLNVVCILDKFSFESLSHEMNLFSLPKSGWKEFLDNGSFDFFLAESIWKWHDEQWIWAMSSPNSPNGERLKEVLEYCDKIGLKKVFWNKEDPVNYDRFISTAKRFDIIFTSDNRSIPQYFEDCGHTNVFAMPFACQPVIHNPVRNKLPLHDVCFAGSWYAREHGDRKRQTKLLVDASRKSGLHIYDRFYGTNDLNRFPSSYSKYVRGSMPYEECCMAYKAYKIFLNVNSVMNSDTMFSRRVFELLASSTHVLSTPSEGMEKMLPYGVSVVDSVESAEYSLTKLLEDDEYRNRSAHLGYRHVMNNHTYAHRVGAILNKLNIECEVPSNNPKVSLVTCTNRPNMISNILQNFNRQTWENKESIIIIDCSQDEYLEILELVKPYENVVLHKVVEGLSLGHCFNKGMELSSGDYIGKFDDDDLYGAHYLSDQLLAFNYTYADIVGKLCTFMYHEKSESTYLRFPDHRHKYGDLILGPTFLFKKKVAETIQMRDLSKSEDTNFLRDAIKSGFRIYATDPYNFVYMRKKVEGFHTWDATDEELLKKATPMGPDDPEKYAFV